MSGDQSPRPCGLAEAMASELFSWEIFLKGYHNNDPEYKRLFSDYHGLNRQQRRRLESKTRKLRSKAGR